MCLHVWFLNKPDYVYEIDEKKGLLFKSLFC